MSNNSNGLTRRAAVRGAVLGVSGLLIPSSLLRAEDAGACAVTPGQTEGPFYPVSWEVERDADLTRIAGSSEGARGDPILVAGRVTDAACRPVKGATVEIWQACWSGRYNHPSDRNPAPLDPHFQYSASVTTNGEGLYAFRTIVPGAYPVGSGWVRPPHIHFRVRRAGRRDLVTQMYFAGQPLNAADRILNGLPPVERERVVVVPEKPDPGVDPRARQCRFDLVLQT